LGKDGVITVEMCYIKNKELNILEVYEKKPPGLLPLLPVSIH
jgi:hypothetical protein